MNVRKRIQESFAKHRWLYVSLCVVLGLIAITLGLLVWLNVQALHKIATAHQLDTLGRYTQGKQILDSVNRHGLTPAVRAKYNQEITANVQAAALEKKLKQIQLLLKEHKATEAKKILASLPPGSSSPQISASVQDAQSQIAQQQAATSSSPTTHASSSSSPSSGSSGRSSTTSGSGGSSGSSSGGSTSGPNTGPLSAITLSGFSASANPTSGYSGLCTTSARVTVNTNGSGQVAITWYFLTATSDTEISNPESHTLSAAGAYNYDYSTSRASVLEAGDSYRMYAVVSSMANPAITATSNTITSSVCQGTHPLAAEQKAVTMTGITINSASMTYNAQDSTFAYYCQTEFHVSYTPNGSGTVEPIIYATSAANIGTSWYDTTDVTGFDAGYANVNTIYTRLPHIGGGTYHVIIKLVEVSHPSTVYATYPLSFAACG